MFDAKYHFQQIANLKSHDEIPRYFESLPDDHKKSFLAHVEQINHSISRHKSGDDNAALLYHGTPHYETIRRDGFKLGKGRRSGFMGSEWEVDNRGIFLTGSKRMAHLFGTNRGDYKKDSETLSVYANLGKTLDFENAPSHIKKKALEAVNKYEGTKKKKLALSDYHWVLDRPEFVEHVKSHGYHSVKFPESRLVRKMAGIEKEEAHTYMVFDPKRLSVHKNHINTLETLHDYAKEVSQPKKVSEGIKTFLEWGILMKTESRS